MQTNWQKIQRILLENAGRTHYSVWLSSLAFSCEKTVVTISAPSLFVLDFIRRQYTSLFEKAVHEVLGAEFAVFISRIPCTVANIFEKLDLAEQLPCSDKNAEILLKDGAISCISSTSTKPIAEPLLHGVTNGVTSSYGALEKAEPRPLPRSVLMGQPAEQLSLPMQLGAAPIPTFQPQYSFDRFVVGASNELAYAASQSMCVENSANMFFLSSGPGLGKTHLMQAAGHALTSACNRSVPRAAYVTAEEFVSRFIHSIKQHDLDSFKGYFRKLDLLLLEDVHFLQGKEKTQLELLATIKTLLDRGSKVVFTSSFAPKELKGLDEQLLSRFYTGFVSHIAMPDKETRRKIFKAKALQHQVLLPEDVEEVLAEHIALDVRQIESCLHNLILKVRLYKNPVITMQMAWEIIGHYVNQTPLTNLDGIIQVVCDVFGLSREQIFSVKRKQGYVNARNAAFYLARKHTGNSLEAIGHKFNRRHSTVLKGITNIEREMSRQTPQGRQMAQTIGMIERSNQHTS